MERAKRDLAGMDAFQSESTADVSCGRDILYMNNFLWVQRYPAFDSSSQDIRVRLDPLFVQCIFIPSGTSWTAPVRAGTVKDDLLVSVISQARRSGRTGSVCL